MYSLLDVRCIAGANMSMQIAEGSAMLNMVVKILAQRGMKVPIIVICSTIMVAVAHIIHGLGFLSFVFRSIPSRIERSIIAGVENAKTKTLVMPKLEAMRKKLAIKKMVPVIVQRPIQRTIHGIFFP